MLTRVTSEFQITSCQCNKDKKIVHNAAMGQNAEVLGDFFPCDSFVALYELFELFLNEGRIRAKRLSRQQGFIKKAYLTILQPPLLFGFFPLNDSFVLKRCDDSRNGPSGYSHPVTGVK